MVDNPLTKNVLLVSAGTIHPPLAGRMLLHRVLRAMPGFAFRRVASMEALPRLDLAQFQAMVLYFHHEKISEPALAAFDGFVRAGGGVLAVHSPTASFKTCLPFFKILGGRFTGHGPLETMHIRPVDGDNAPFDGIPPFEVQDELYIHELQPTIRPHFEVSAQGQVVPVVWTYTYGQGKVCYLCPGHTTGSIRHPSVQEIARRGLQWVSA